MAAATLSPARSTGCRAQPAAGCWLQAGVHCDHIGPRQCALLKLLTCDYCATTWPPVQMLGKPASSWLGESATAGGARGRVARCLPQCSASAHLRPPEPDRSKAVLHSLTLIWPAAEQPILLPSVELESAQVCLAAGGSFASLPAEQRRKLAPGR